MKSTLLILIWFAIHSLCRTDHFRPLPIPIGWRYDISENGTDRRLPEDIILEKVNTHYWEEALRHSVYLALVRDRIDELIARGDTKDSDSTAISDAVHHNLWHKIKTASFHGIYNEEPPSAGDVIVIARGRLIDFGKEFRFVEDRPKGEICKDDNCMEGVKALWSVKRSLHRDDQTPGQHYELTFSVLTHRAKKHRKLQENPVRTFTVRETAPVVVVDDPKELKSIENVHLFEPRHRGGGTIWFHKNIRPITRQQGRQLHDQKTDRIFTSFFSDEDDEPPRRPFQNSPPPHSKTGYVGAPSDQHQQKKISPFAYKQYKLHNPAKYSRPPSPPVVAHSQHHYLDIDAIGVVSNPYIHQQSDHTHVGPPKSNPSRPPVLPTPLPSHAKGHIEKGTTRYHEVVSATSKPPEVITAHNRPLPTPMKISYFADHVRPPVYNTPPGVFVTMDKKPFKPLPPLKYQQHLKHKKPQKMLDFRPSPQVLDIEFSEPDPLLDSAFRPITVNYALDNNEAIVISKPNNVHASNNTEADHSKQNATKKFRSTTPVSATTESNAMEEDGIESWTNLLGAFSKTTPMASQKDNATDNTTSSTTSATLKATQTPEKNTTTTKSMEKNATIATTAATTKRRRRTRPPRKFKSKSNSTNTTEAPKRKRVFPNDLTPQASSNTATTTSMSMKSSPSSTSTTTVSTTTATMIRNPTTAASTTKAPNMTTTQPTTVSQSDTQISTTTETQNFSKEKSSKKQNRYRQSTLMQKGTSVNHDKWSMNVSESKSTVRKVPSTMTQNGRRNISNFQGYSATTIKPTDESIEDFFKNWYLSTTQSSTDSIFETPADHFQSSLESGSEETLNPFNDKYKTWDDYHFENDDNSTANKKDEEFKKDEKPLDEIELPSREVSENQEELEVVIPTSEAPRVTPKPKCKHRNGTKVQPSTTPPTKEESELIASKVSEEIITDITTPDMFQELSDAFGSFNNIETESKSIESSKLEAEDIVDKSSEVKNSEKMPQRESKEYNYDDELESVGESVSDERFYDDYEENPRSFFDMLSMG